MQEVEVVIDKKIYIKCSECDRELKTAFRKAYTFKSNKTFGDKIEYRTIYSKEEMNGVEVYVFPPNMSYFNEKIIKEFNGKIKFRYVDRRVKPLVEGFVSNVIPRENQVQVLKDMEAVGYNALITAKTSFGKTALSLYLAELLKTPMLFIAARTNLINNFSLIECKKFGINPEHITEINAEWLKNPVITPIMVSSVQALSEEILEELYNKIGLVIFDEIHISATSEVYSERVFSINSRHNLYLSATPAHSDYSIEFTKAMLSNNIIDSPENLDFKIDLVTLNGVVPQSVHLRYNTVYTSHEKREVLFTEEYIKKICELGYCLVNEGRGVLIYNDDNSTQEQMAEMLRMLCLRVGVLNSNTSSKDKKEILENFDNGKYQILVSGASISAGVSLNRLSCIIDTSIKINENNLQQLLGRLKRVDREVCDKSKLYIKVTSQGLSSKKWNTDINALKEFNYINFHKEVRLEHYAKFSLVRVYKEFRKNLNYN